MKVLSYWIAIGLAALLVGMAGLLVALRTPPGGNTGSAQPLDGTQWQLAEIQDGAGATLFAPNEPGAFTLRFADQAGGRGGCNSYGGPYTSDHATGSLSFGELASTMMACDTPLMRWETPFFMALSHANRYALDGAILRIFVDQDGQVLVFRPAP